MIHHLSPHARSLETPAGNFRAWPTVADLGFTPAVRGVLVAEGLILAACVVVYARLGLSFAWRSAWDALAVTLVPWLAWGYFYALPSRSRTEWAIAERALIVGCFFLAVLLHPQAQYVALALKRPLIGHLLATVDAACGWSVVAATAWTRAHPAVRHGLQWAYFTLVAQLWLPLVVLGFSVRSRAHLREYIVHFVAGSLVTVVCFALWPAETPSTFYGFSPLLSQAHVAQQIAAVRDGSLTLIDLDHLDGVVSFPSFHAMAAVLVTWALRETWGRWLVAGVNVLLVCATVALGMHFVSDVVAGLAIALLLIICLPADRVDTGRDGERVTGRHLRDRLS